MHCKLNIKNIITQSSELLGLFEQMGKRPRVYYNHKVIFTFSISVMFAFEISCKYTYLIHAP